MASLIEIFWYFLPAGVANIAPVLVKKVPILNYPMDFKMKFRKKRVFGSHKTWRGLVAGVIAAILSIYVQRSFGLGFTAQDNAIFIGVILGLGALLGDAIESFFKRQSGIKPGKSWVPFDQIDWILGAVILANFFYIIPLADSVIAVVMFGALHPLVNYIGYLLGLKKNKF